MNDLNMQPKVPANNVVAGFDKSKPVRAMLKQLGITDALQLDGVTEVAINRPGELWVEQKGVWRRIDAPHVTFDLCNKLAQAMAVSVSNKSNQLSQNPICPVELPDGERGQIVMPPASQKGTISLTIRKPSLQRFTLDDYEQTGRLSSYSVVEKQRDLFDWQKEMVMCVKNGDMRKFFRLAVFHKLNLVFGGGTGSGKTTFSKAIIDLYPTARRYVTIENIHELQMPHHPNRVHLFFSDILPAKTLVQSCMRMKPDHIFMAELTGDETWDYLTALKTGHKGSLTTAHFGDCNSASARLTDMVKQSSVGLTLDYRDIYRTVETQIDAYFYWEGSYLKEVLYQPEEKLRLLNGE